MFRKIWDEIRKRRNERKIKKQFMQQKGKDTASVLKRILLTFNRYLMVLGGAILLYIVLLFLLVLTERGAKDATITNFGEAVWYSLATFTTVGYGDFYPVTPAGRTVASVFLILGIGLLGFFVGFMVDFINRIKPMVMLSMNAGKPWYVFSDKSANAMIFAENLKAVRPNAMIIYAGTTDIDSNAKYICVPWTVEEVLDRRGSLFDAHILCMKDNEMENFLDAVRLAELNVPVICLASFTPAYHPMNINFFSLSDCTARIFWQQYPVTKTDETIVLIGFEKAGTVLLDRALELNVISTDQHIHYHVFGDAREYRRNRKRLGDFVSIDRESEKQDCVFFHEDLWNTDELLLEYADRIVLCSDSEQENIAILHTIQKFFAIKGNVYIYNSNVRSVATPFGQTRDVLTPAFVLHNRLTDMALCRHELYRFQSGEDIPMWENLNSLTKDQNYIATDHISIKTRILLGDEAPNKPFDELPASILRKAGAVFSMSIGEEREQFRRIEHERNRRYYMLHNFHYGEKTDDEARLNPLLRDYDKLPEEKKALADISWMLLDELAAHKEARGAK